MSQGIIQVSDLHKSFGANRILNGISLEVKRGEVVVIIGPSGSGKSTFLRCCNGLEQAESGSIRICGERLLEKGIMLEDMRLNALRTHVGMVFQSFNLFPHLTILQNVAIGPRKILQQPKAHAEQLAMQLLDKVGLGHKADAMPASLSGGQKQRVAIARALALQPEVMLFDEPTSALDPELVDEVLAVMKQLAREGMTMLVVTHEMSFAREMADTLVVMEEGRIVEAGPAAAIFARPAHARTQALLKKIS
ncbi:amino acid ABC transporter ATP-binding protein (PAAT family) [Gibbsiella quercinecans]|uniref:ABC transporter ATP-binding protein n=2 Tax=Gibbsiella TaxID=929812 RepID=A0A250B3P8_9GAMM|nr:amino acid ABC transporter ATP-binding protein [Gibbsiella quercinecans]ATA20794.1 ABC transporter ATP-binding protein [Gibbsiella quercinecans]RLM10422.1 ABC transporter ATP-binding protein [Gibbsiella quercinecans]TCT85923.1 amino acid ABC transporter ATP-binding protein (PAAT family) [Gibbsiella quercinecans]